MEGAAGQDKKMPDGMVIPDFPRKIKSNAKGIGQAPGEQQDDAHREQHRPTGV